MQASIDASRQTRDTLATFDGKNPDKAAKWFELAVGIERFAEFNCGSIGVEIWLGIAEELTDENVSDAAEEAESEPKWPEDYCDPVRNQLDKRFGCNTVDNPIALKDSLEHDAELKWDAQAASLSLGDRVLANAHAAGNGIPDRRHRVYPAPSA